MAWSWPWSQPKSDPKLSQILSILNSLKQQVGKMSQQIDALTKAVADNGTAIQNMAADAKTLIQLVSDLKAKLPDPADSAAIDKAISDLNTSTAAAVDADAAMKAAIS